MSSVDDVEFVRAVRLRPGDVLVLKSSRRLTHEQVERIQNEARSVFGDFPVAVLPPELDLAVVSRDELGDAEQW